MMCRLIFAACLFVAFSSTSEGAEDFIYKLDNNVTIGYCAQHDYFVFYNPKLNLAFLHNSKLNIKMYTDTKHGTVLLVTQAYGYVFASNYTYEFDTDETFMATFDYIWCQTEPLLNIVHGGNCETCNGIAKKEFKTCLLLDKDDIDLTTWQMFVKRPQLAQQLNLGFHDLFEQSHYDLCNFTSAVQDYSTFTYAGMQPIDEQTVSVALFFKGIISNQLTHTQELSVEFYNYLVNRDYSSILTLDHALESTSIFYTSSSEALTGYKSSFTYTTKEITINKLLQKVTFSRDSSTLDWFQKFETQYDEVVIVYYANINVLIFWYVQSNCILLFEGNGNNYAVYNVYNGVGIIVNKHTGKAIITNEDAALISAHYTLNEIRKAFECAAKVVRSTDCDHHGSAKFDFTAFILSCYDHGRAYYPFDNGLKTKLYTYFSGLIRELHHIKGFNLLLSRSNIVLLPFKRFQLNALNTEYVKLMHNIGMKAGSCFDSTNMTNVYNDVMKSSDVPFKAKIFNDFGV